MKINKFRPFEQSDAEWSNGRWTKDGKYCVTMRRPDTVYV